MIAGWAFLAGLTVAAAALRLGDWCERSREQRQQAEAAKHWHPAP